MTAMTRTRIAVGAVGVLLGLFGAFRLLTEVPFSDLVVLLVWLAAAVIIHDGIVSPTVLGVGWAVARIVPPRARASVQGGLVCAALVTAIAVPLILRENTQPTSKAILRQNYFGNLMILLALVAAGAAVVYVVRVVRGPRGGRVPVHVDPPDDAA